MLHMTTIYTAGYPKCNTKESNKQLVIYTMHTHRKGMQMVLISELSHMVGNCSIHHNLYINLRKIFILKNINCFSCNFLCIDSVRFLEKHEHYSRMYLILIVVESLYTDIDSKLYFRGTGYCIGHSQATYMRIWYQWMQKGLAQRQKLLQMSHHICPREDSYIVMALVERTVTCLTQRTYFSTQQSVTKRTIRSSLQCNGMSVRHPLLHIPLILNHKRLRLQCCIERPK